MHMTPEEVRQRAFDCFEKGLCFISLKPLGDNPVSAQWHRDVPHSLPVLVLKQYDKTGQAK
jgi:hypothetical protein